MRIMPWRCTKTSTLRLTAQHEIYRLFPRQSIGAVEEMKSCQTPVNSIEAEVFREVVFELVFAGVEGLDIFYVGGDGELQFGWEGG